MNVSAHAHLLKVAKMVHSKTLPNWQTFRFCTKPGTHRLILHSIV